MLQRIPYFSIHLHQPAKGEEPQTQFSFSQKKVAAVREPHCPGKDKRQNRERGKGKTGKDEKEPSLSPSPEGSSPCSAATCHLAAADSIAPKPFFPPNPVQH